MTPEQIFSIVNLIALAGWVLLAVLPGRRWVSGTIAAAVIPALLAVAEVSTRFQKLAHGKFWQSH